MPQIIGAPTPVVNVTPEEMATFAAVNKFLAPLGIGLHCAACGEDMRGANAETRNTFSVECGCREFKAANPSPRKIFYS